MSLAWGLRLADAHVEGGRLREEMEAAVSGEPAAVRRPEGVLDIRMETRWGERTDAIVASARYQEGTATP